MLGDINPQTIKIDQQAVVYPGRDHVTTLTIKRYDGRSYRPVDTSALTRVVLVFPDADPVISYDSDLQPAVFAWAGSTITIDLSDYAMPASSLPCYLIAFDAEHLGGQVLVDNVDTTLEFDFRNVSTTGTTPAPAIEFVTEAPIDGSTYGRKDGAWVDIGAGVGGVISVNGQTGIVVLSAADVGADPAGEAAAEVALHEATLDPHPQYTTAAEAAASAPVQSVNGETGVVVLSAADVGADASGVAADAVAAHVGEADPHTQYLTQTEGDARYERGLTAGTNITIDRTNPAAPVISASGGGGGAVDSVNGQTGTVVLDTDDVSEGVVNLYHTNARAAAAAPVQSVNGETGAVSLSAADVGADAAGTADGAVAAHEAASDPHPQYLTSAEGNAAYAPVAHVGAGGTAHANVVSGGAAGFMTGTQSAKLDGIAAGATANATTDTLAEGSSNKYFTESRVLATLMAGFTLVAGGTVLAADSLLVAIGKLQKQVNDALYAPVITESTTARILALSDGAAYIRHTNASASTVTIPPQSSVSWAADTEIHIRRAAAGNLTLTPGSGVTLNAPSGGTLVLTNNMSVTLKRVSSDVWDVIGQTVPV